MNSFKKIILITKRYPYFYTESFLESEIGILSKYFDEILICPLEINNQIREIPENVSVDTSLSSFYGNKTRKFLRTITSIDFWKSLGTEFNKIKSLKDLKLLFIHNSSSLAIYDYFKGKQELNKYELIYSYWLNSSVSGIVKLREKGIFNGKIVSRAHRYDVYEGQNTKFSFWPERQKILNFLDKVYSISDDAKEYLESKYSVSGDKIIVSRIGVFDLGYISNKPGDDSFRIVSVSRVEALKRVELIAECIFSLVNKRKERKFKWIHFGDGSQLNLIKENAANVQLNNLRIEFKGHVANQEVYSFYKDTHINLFINLSSSEGIPVSIMEAQSFGIPTVATDVGGTKEIVYNGVGVLLDSNPSVNEVVLAIEDILDGQLDPVLIKESWSKRYNASTNYHEFGENLNNLLKD